MPFTTFIGVVSDSCLSIVSRYSFSIHDTRSNFRNVVLSLIRLFLRRNESCSFERAYNVYAPRLLSVGGEKRKKCRICHRNDDGVGTGVRFARKNSRDEAKRTERREIFVKL